jgi:hypothetical protein
MLVSPQNLRDGSDADPDTDPDTDPDSVPDTDPLADALAVADARAAMSGAFVAGGDWAVRLHAPERLKVNCVVRGAPVLVREDSGEQVRLAAGDVIVSDGALPYVMASSPDIAPLPSGELPTDPRTGFRRIGSGEDVMCVSGHVDLSRDRGGLLRAALPSLVHVRGDAPEATILRRLIENLLDERPPAAPAPPRPWTTSPSWSSCTSCASASPTPQTCRPGGYAAWPTIAWHRRYA